MEVAAAAAGTGIGAGISPTGADGLRSHSWQPLLCCAGCHPAAVSLSGDSAAEVEVTKGLTQATCSVGASSDERSLGHRTPKTAAKCFSNCASPAAVAAAPLLGGPRPRPRPSLPPLPPRPRAILIFSGAEFELTMAFNFDDFTFEPGPKRPRAAERKGVDENKGASCGRAHVLTLPLIEEVVAKPVVPALDASGPSCAPPHGPTTADPSAAADVRLAELKLIQKYRTTTPASVDVFHRFLLSLGERAHGRFWALVACLLSVQCRDSVALEVCRRLMTDAPDGPADVAALPKAVLEDRCRRCNYYLTKASNIRAVSEIVVRASGRVPCSYEGLVALPGVGAKIGHLMRSVAFSDDGSGIVVDTHVCSSCSPSQPFLFRYSGPLSLLPSSPLRRCIVSLRGWVGSTLPPLARGPRRPGDSSKRGSLGARGRGSA